MIFNNKMLIRGTVLCRLLLLTLLIISMAGVSAFAYDEGQTISYSGHESATTAVVFTVDGNRGFCCEPGLEIGGTGRAKITKRYDANELMAKVIYKYAYQEHWDTRGGIDSEYGYYWEVEMQAVVQYAAEGNEAVSYWKSGPGGRWSNDFCNYLISKANAARNVTAPDTFGVYLCDPTDSGQGFVFYKANDEPVAGNLTLQKTANKTPQNNQGASLAGAVYYVYTDSACTIRAKDTSGNNVTLTTTTSGATNTVEIKKGTYYAKEITASPGFNLDTNVLSATVTKGGTATFSSTEVLQTGYVSVKKVSGNTDITG